MRGKASELLIISLSLDMGFKSKILGLRVINVCGELYMGDKEDRDTDPVHMTNEPRRHRPHSLTCSVDRWSASPGLHVPVG